MPKSNTVGCCCCCSDEDDNFTEVAATAKEAGVVATLNINTQSENLLRKLHASAIKIRILPALTRTYKCSKKDEHQPNIREEEGVGIKNFHQRKF